jgi:hypothetical protein
MVDQFISGLDLTEDLDLAVDATGDLRSSEGLDELEKDLSFRLILAFEDVTLGILDPRTREEIRVTATEAVTADPRVTALNDVTVFDGDSIDEVVVGIAVEAGEDSITLTQEL